MKNQPPYQEALIDAYPLRNILSKPYWLLFNLFLTAALVIFIGMVLYLPSFEIDSFWKSFFFIAGMGVNFMIYLAVALNSWILRKEERILKKLKSNFLVQWNYTAEEWLGFWSSEISFDKHSGNYRHHKMRALIVLGALILFLFVYTFIELQSDSPPNRFLKFIVASFIVLALADAVFKMLRDRYLSTLAHRRIQSTYWGDHQVFFNGALIQWQNHKPNSRIYLCSSALHQYPFPHLELTIRDSAAWARMQEYSTHRIPVPQNPEAWKEALALRDSLEENF